MKPLKHVLLIIAIFQAVSTLVGFIELLIKPEWFAPMLSGTFFADHTAIAAFLLGVCVGSFQWSAVMCHIKYPQWLPLAHTIGVHGCRVDVEIREDHVFIEAHVRTADRTGVEMEALTCVTVAALSVIDMVKGVDRSAYIAQCGITAKSGGRSGDWSRELP